MPKSKDEEAADRLTRTIAMAKQAQSLAARFIERQTEQPELAWELLVELQALVDELRETHPPRPFRKR